MNIVQAWAFLYLLNLGVIACATLTCIRVYRVVRATKPELKRTYRTRLWLCLGLAAFNVVYFFAMPAVRVNTLAIVYVCVQIICFGFIFHVSRNDLNRVRDTR